VPKKGILMRGNYYSKLKASNSFIRSFNYIGTKYKLLPILFKLMPNNINKFYDVMCGSAVVGINSNAKQIVLNDLDHRCIDLIRYCQQNLLQDTLDFLKKNQPYTKEQFLQLYVNTNHPLEYLLRKKNAFMGKWHTFRNDSAGRHFDTPANIKKYTKLINLLQSKDICFSNLSYDEISIEQDINNYVYIDPPYITTFQEYKRNFTNHDSVKLVNFITSLHNRHINFGLSYPLFTTKGCNMLLMQLIQANKFIVYVIELNANEVFEVDNIDTFYKTWLDNGKVNKYEMFITNYRA
jgi:site-specific DNA-adenine methylase